VINSVVASQPTCTPQSGSITINATGNSTLEYSINNGANWQTANVFNNLTPGNYPVVVRLQTDPSCLTNYNANPVVLNEPTNCAPCLSFNAADLPKPIDENLAITSSIINFTTAGTITDVNIKNLNGSHTYVGDLTFSIVSPQNTTVVLLAKQCTSADNFSISFDDQAAAAFACPMNDGQTRQPANALSAFTGQNPQGNWTLRILDDGQGDVGTLNGWTLEVCVQTDACTPPTITSVASTQPSCETQTGTITVNATGTGTLEYSVNNGTNWQENNIFNNLPPGQYPVVVRLQANTACLSNYNQNPVVLNAAADCNNCLAFVAGNLPIMINDNATVTSTIDVTRQGTITDVNIKNVTGTHSFVGDLTFTLISPQNTTVVLLTNQCGGVADFNISFSDLGTAFACPLNDNQTRIPENPLSVLKGQSSIGQWKLQVQDNVTNDVGSLAGWTLELCGNFANANCPANLNVDNAPMVTNGVFQAEVQVTCASTVPAGNNVTFQAGNNCELRPNFAVEQNATLEVRIGACTN
jgi:subtilisin-like proprotein convertase family protein